MIITMQWSRQNVLKSFYHHRTNVIVYEVDKRNIFENKCFNCNWIISFLLFRRNEGVLILLQARCTYYSIEIGVRYTCIKHIIILAYT